MQRMKSYTRAFLLCVWNTAALISIALVVSYGVVSMFAGSGAVWEASDFELFTKSVPVNGTVKYRMDTKSIESCPGEVVVTLQSLTNHGPPAIVTYRRPVMRVGISTNDNISSWQLSEAVFPGKWRVLSAIESRCPKRTRSDTLADFQIEVTP